MAMVQFYKSCLLAGLSLTTERNHQYLLLKKSRLQFLRSCYSVILDKQSNDICGQHDSARRGSNGPVHKSWERGHKDQQESANSVLIWMVAR